MPSPRGPAVGAHRALAATILCGVAALWIAGCAKNAPVEANTKKGAPAKTAKSAAKKSLPKAEGNCISPRAVTNFRVLDRSRILVDTYPARVIVLYDSCDGVRFMEELQFVGSEGIVCDYRNDALIVRGVRCPIAAITDYEADADAELRKEIESTTPEGQTPKKKSSSKKTAPKSE